ncbi:MAG: hypothetical protein ACRC2B_16000 [Rubrivivax sp.]
MAALASAALVGAPLPALSQVDGLDDLMYQSVDYASRSLPQRGYVLAGSVASKGSSFWQYWWSDARGQCARLAINDYRVTQLIGTGAGDCHRGSNLPVAPQAGSDNGDLLNQSEDYVARQLPRRGYVLSHSASAKGGSYWQYWWSAQRDQCLRAAVNGGRVTQLITTDEHDCNQTASSSKGPSKGAQIAIAAAAIAGVAALAHKSHENQKDRATQSPQDVAEFERGYRDGLYNQGYHNYNNRPDYSSGYTQGNEKRASETSYRSNQGHHSGYAGYVNVNDLVGARASSADDELRSRGFRNTSGYKANERAYSYWWNGNTRQCLNAAVHDGRVESLTAAAEDYCQK